MPIRIDYNKCCWKNGNCSSGCGCVACEGCAETCPLGAIKREDIVRIDENLCTECGICVNACKYGALSLEI